MSKKSPRKRSSARKSVKYGIHIMWTTFFLAVVAALNIYYMGSVGARNNWSLAAVASSLVAILFLGFGKKKGEFMWAILFSALTVGVSLFILAATNYVLWSMTAFASAVIALALLCFEKYGK